GLYLTLFIVTIPVLVKRAKRSSSRVFLYGNIFLFLNATVTVCISASKLIRAFGLQVMHPKMPITYYEQFGIWDGISLAILADLGVWTADALVIYRCFIVWNKNYWVILVPCLLLIVSIVTGGVMVTHFIDPTRVTREQVTPFFTMVFPVNLAQVFLTTGLIAFHLFRVHATSRAAGLQSDDIGLLTVARIMVESAAVYTIQQIVLLVLYLVKHPAQMLLHGTLLPSLGIVFLLMALRTYKVQ
ncbi:hypothetical protein FA15DRAFT_556394, partial [Coprinopsis marcescibilis]